MKNIIVAALILTSSNAMAAKLYEIETYQLQSTSVVVIREPGSPIESAFVVKRQCIYSTSQPDVVVKKLMRVNEQCATTFKNR